MNLSGKFGVAVILSGPSGSGKSTVLSAVMKDRPDLEFSVSCTTRPPRPGEVNGKDYYFLTVEEFQSKAAQGLFLEHAEVHGNFYGTLKSEILDRVRTGRNVVLDIDVQGAMSVREICRKDPVLARCCEFIFISPPSPEELEKRLRNRGTETEENLLRRLANARREMTFAGQYDYWIINDSISQAAADFSALFRSFELAVKRRPEA